MNKSSQMLVKYFFTALTIFSIMFCFGTGNYETALSMIGIFIASYYIFTY